MSKPPYWFKRRRYGLGWIPTTWQGWLIIVAFAAIVLWGAFMLPSNPRSPSTAQLLVFFGILAADLVALLLVMFARAPSPRWRWGKRDDDNPEEDF